MEDVSVFLGTAIENLALRSGFAFHSWQTPHTQEKCITWPKQGGSQVAEVADL